MPDNVNANAGSGGATFAAASLSFSGDTSVIPIGSGAILTGSEGSWTQSLIVGGAGAVTAGTQRMTLASDDPAVSTLSTINGKITACNTGAVVISSGTVAATQSGTWTVGLSAAQTLATVTTVSTVTNLAQLGGVAVAMGSGARSAGTQRVTIATDDVVPASQSGTWTVGLSAGQTLATVTNLAQLGGAAIAMGSGVRSAGTQRVTIATDDVVPASQSGTWTVGISAAQTLATVTTVGTLTGGGVAHDGIDSGNPVKVGGRAISSLASSTLVASADRSDLLTDIDGTLLVRLNRPMGDGISERVTNTDGASTAFANFGAVAGVRNLITTITVFNSSATAGFVDFRDGTAGSVLWTMPLPAGGGAVISGANALFRTSANTALAYDVSAALSTVYISVSGFQSKV